MEPHWIQSAALSPTRNRTAARRPGAEDMIQLVHDFLRATAARFPDRPSLICAGQTYTFEQIDDASGRLARELQRKGVMRGDRVVVFTENCAELAISLFGILKAGAAFVIINPTTKAAKLTYLLRDCIRS